MAETKNIGVYLLELIERLQHELWQNDPYLHMDEGFEKSPFIHADTLKEEVAKLFDL